MTDLDSVLTNQTQFSLEEPYYQGVTQPADDEVQPPKKSNSKKMLVVLASILVLLLLLLLLAVVSRRPVVTPNSPFQQGTLETPTSVQANPFAERIKRLETELEEADPLRQTLLFPPIDMDIRLDP